MHALLALALVCSAASGAQPPAVNTNELVRADNRLGLDIFSYLSVERPQENVFISPLSIALALQMTAHGAANLTWDAMAGAMYAGHLDRSGILAGNADLRNQLLKADPKVRLDIANSLWLRKGVKLQKRFSDDCAKYYGAGVTVLDFARADAVTTINNWVAKNTGDRIKQVISQLTPDEIIVLINAIYFKGKWTKEFDPRETGTRSFYFADGKTTDRKMMNREGRYRYREDGEMQAVALPYGDGRLNMYIFLPREKEGLGGLVAGLGPEVMDRLFDAFSERKGEIVLPRFKIEFENSLTKVLKLLGMGPAFSPGADFSGMVVPPSTAAISEVIHKTFIEVNEEGTEAAAVTAVRMVATAMPNRDENFSLVCDHPFLVAIRDDVTGSVLFLGAIYDPKQ
jgi:serine protease inhibitor